MNNMPRIAENMFLFLSMIVSMIGWLIAFVGAIIFNRGLTGGSWWIIVFELFLISGTSAILITNTFAHYRLMILTFLAVSISLVIYQLDYVLPTYKFPKEYRNGAGTYAAGYILIMLVQFLWVIVFGSEPESYIGKYAPIASNSNAVGIQQQQQQPQSDVTQHEKPVSPTTTATSPSPVPATTIQMNNNNNTSEYKERVQALHAYNANPDDPNELSFSKGEILEIVDRNGNWWQARRSDGSVGIIPSNYFGPSL